MTLGGKKFPMTAILDVSLAAAEQAHAAGDLVDAAHLYQTLLAQTPDDAAAWRGLGLVARDLGELEQAGLMLSRAIELGSGVIKGAAQRDLAVLLVDAGQADAGLDLVLEASVTFSQAAQWAEEMGCLTWARQLRADHPHVVWRLPRVIYNYAYSLCDSEPETALRLGEEGHALDPTHVGLLRMLATLYSRNNNLERRCEVTSRIIALFDAQAPAAPASQGVVDSPLVSLTAQQIADALLADGVIVIRGMLDAAAQAHYLAQQERRWLASADDALVGIAPEILDAMAIMFRHPLEPMVQGCNVRTASVTDDQSFLYYHQDITPLFTMGVNLWAALDPIDGTRPGLEVLARRQHHAFPIVPGHIRSAAPYRIPDELVRGAYPDDAFVAPRMEPGDGMLFLFSTVHRSVFSPDMPNSRRNAELRFY